MDKKLNRIKVVLVEKDISQTELAQRLGKSFSTVNGYCCNRQQPSLDVLNQIAEILDVSSNDEYASDYLNIDKFDSLLGEDGMCPF